MNTTILLFSIPIIISFIIFMLMLIYYFKSELSDDKQKVKLAYIILYYNSVSFSFLFFLIFLFVAFISVVGLIHEFPFSEVFVSNAVAYLSLAVLHLIIAGSIRKIIRSKRDDN